MKIDQELSLKFARLSFIAAVMVVVQHMYAPYWSGWIETSVCHGLVLWNVPYFFFAAGFFLFSDFELSCGWYLDKLRSRLSSLLVPYACWTIWGMLVMVVSVFVGLRSNTFDLTSVSWWLDKLGVTAASAYSGHLWFLRRLMLFIVVSPLIGIVVRKCGLLLVPVFLGEYIFNFPSAATWSNLAFFVLGAFFSNRVPELLEFSLAVRKLWPIWSGLFAGLVAGRPFFLSLPQLAAQRTTEVAVIIFGLLTMWSLYDYGKSHLRICDHVLHYSFFLYCLHYPLLVYVKVPMHALLPPMAPGIFGVLSSSIIMLAGCLVLASIASYHLPRVFDILNGRRIKHD